MKPISLFILLFLASNAWSNNISLSGSSFNGDITLSGLLKKLINKNTIPLGGLRSYHGYEAIDFSKHKAQYCLSGVSTVSSPSLLGISFGGEVGKFKTFDRCLEPKDYEGGFLSIGLSFDLKAKSKSINGGLNLNLGFDLNRFSTQLQNSLHNDLKIKLFNTVMHLARYSLKKKTKTILASDIAIFKLFLLPFSPLLIAQKSMTAEELITADDIKLLTEWNTKDQGSTLKERISQSIWNIKRDAELYNCKGDHCSDTLVNVLYFLEAIEDNLGDCHSISTNFSIDSALDLKIPFITSKLSFSFGYSYYALNGVVDSKLSTEVLATKQFMGHHFLKRAQACENVTQSAASGYANFLKLLNTK